MSSVENMDWADRPAPRAATPAKLASMIDAAQARRAKMLFTLTPTEELDAIGVAQRLRDQAFALQLRAVVIAYNNACNEDREFAADEIALAVNTGVMAAGNLLTLALSACELPGLVEAVEDGLLTERHVRAVVAELDAVGRVATLSFPTPAVTPLEELLGMVDPSDGPEVEGLTLEQRQAVVTLALARYTGQTPGQLATLVAKLILQIDLGATARREKVATAQRHLRIRSGFNGQACLTAIGPVARLAAIKARLAAQLADTIVEDGDLRTASQREFDLFADLLTSGELTDQAVAPYLVEVLVPFRTATSTDGATGEGCDLELAEIPGFGPILPGTARELMEQAAFFGQVAVDENGEVIAVGTPIPAQRAADQSTPARETTAQETTAQETTAQETTAQETTAQETAAQETAAQETAAPAQVSSEAFLTEALRAMATPPPARHRAGNLTTDAYRVPKRLQRILEVRDRTCVFPGCTRPAVAADKDHRLAWPKGLTSAENLQCLCRRHHRAKQAVFTVSFDARTRTLTWGTRGGWLFRRHRGGF